ncbi:spore germination protein [Scopulibacillus darangshiensis]|uniref:Spore germination protein n=1 Tax=Scopulibacillus darangshiensis TaxID=442528 RepID=A0A4R2P9B4_9BACL|nr:glycoside hydrolase family 18 protein [Scopulibacillus darangshiensis]TCP31603.1 spore germination protein [Scopulibacillus darangshiensis]
MQIHVVSSGDTLYSLAQAYRISAQQLADLNNITNPNQLVVGQTLLMPTSDTYIVQSGDSLWTIAQKLNIPYQSLVAANENLSGQTLQPGMTVTLPQKKKQRIVVNGFLEPSQNAVSHFQEAEEALTFLSIFSYEAKANGSITPPDNEAALLDAVKESRTQPLMVLTNIANGEFDRDVAKAILSSTSVQNQFIQNVINALKNKGYRGVNIDFEFLGKNTRKAYNRFLRRITDRLHRENFIVCTSVAPKLSGRQTGAWYEAHDYEAHGKIVDYVILMTYEWGWSGGPPMPVSPITQVRRVVNYARSVIPRKKIIMSIPLYGYDWTLPYEEGGEFAKAVSTNQAYQLARQHNRSIDYDTKEEAPFFHYTAQDGKEHIVWFEDLRTMRAMFHMVDQYDLGGISFWNLAFRYPPVWAYLNDYFEVRKV